MHTRIVNKIIHLLNHRSSMWRGVQEKAMFNGTVKPLSILLVMCWHSSVNAVIVYDELASGDLPGLNAAILILEVGAGSNEINGELGLYPDTADSFSIDLRNGFRLDSIILTKCPVPENGYNIGLNLHYADSLQHLSVNQDDLGVDILPLLNTLWGPGFSSPIENDIIEISLLQTLSRNAYGFDFVVSHVPTPPAAWLFGSGLLGFIGIGRRKKAA